MMLAKYTKTSFSSRVLPIIATLLIALVHLTLAEVAQAERSVASATSRASKISVLLKRSGQRPDETISVIVTLNGARTELLNAFFKQNGVRLRRDFKNLGSFSLSLPYSRLAQLASFPEISSISSNEVVFSLGHVSSTTGADVGRDAAFTAGHGVIDGSGIGIAVLDSGISADHAQFAPAASRILASVDFTGENRTDDPFGHGTFVVQTPALIT
jgi:subtilisin family serine protease